MAAPQPFYEDRGTPIALRQVLDALSQLGYESDVVTYPVGQSVAIPGVRYFRLPNPLRIQSVPIGLSLRKLWFDGGMARALRERLRSERYECIHAVEEAAFLAVALGRRYHVPVIYDMQSSFPEQLAKFALFQNRPAQAALRGAERWLLRNANLVVCSAGLGEHVRVAAPETRLWGWRFAGIDPAVRPDDVTALRTSLDIAPQAPVVLYSGTFEQYQGLGELLDAIPLVRAEFPDVVFVLVGARGIDGEALKRQSSQSASDGALRLVERQPRELLPRYLAMANVLVSPRMHGGNLPLKVFDYLAAGRPIVATDIATHRNFLDNGRALLVAAGASELAEGITAVLRDPALACQLAARARMFTEEHLGWMAFVQSVYEIYQAAVTHD
ncbi:MAG TPA: glycosyltransferase [Gemmatimonadaceae bacterium]|nr:glycosyltransferase [Gemmatimonadaceae bacterium]